MNTIIENQTGLLAYYKHPRNTHMLNKGAKYLTALIGFVRNCIYSETAILSPNRYELYIESELKTISNCTDIDDYCEIIRQLIQTLTDFPRALESDITDYHLQKDSDPESCLYCLLQAQSESLLNFIQKYDIMSKNELEPYAEFFQTFYARRNQLLFKYLSPNEAYQSCISFLSANFKSYRSAKKGNPILRTISQMAGGFLGGLLGETFGLDLSTTFNLGIQLGAGAEQLTTTFVSQSKQDKITMYEEMLEQVLSYISNLSTAIWDDIGDLAIKKMEKLSELYLTIFEWANERHLHKKNVRVLLNELNYIHFSDWNNTTQRYILEKLNYFKECKRISYKEYRMIKKLISKGI